MNRDVKISLFIVGIVAISMFVIRNKNKNKDCEGKSSVNGDIIVRYNTNLLGAEVLPHPNWMKF